MKRISFLILVFVSCSILLMAQKEKTQLWVEVQEKNIPQHQIVRELVPLHARILKLDMVAFQSILQNAPLVRSQDSEVILDIPLPDGRIERFKVFYAPIMEEGLAKKYPEIKSYTAFGLDDPTATMRFDLSPRGLHAMILSGEHPTVLINPYGKGTIEYYQSFYKSDYKRLEKEPFQCAYNPMNGEALPVKSGGLQKSADCNYRNYRLAVACTGEYAAFHGGNIPDVLAAMNTTMTRVNGILERDLNITLVLVANNDQLLFMDGETDPFSNGSGSAMLGQNQTTCDDIIGSSSYDMGHVFSTGGGGVAYLASVCKPYKAGGVTGQLHPVGDPFDIDYVTHEMGHQLGANHTQNNTCNRFDNAAVEPGSASTIMGYAGICAPNIQSNSDAYFHAISIQEIATYLSSTTGNSCAQQIDNGNSRPIINTMINYTIPAATPFVLTANATDSDGDGLTYCWEQMDNEIASMPPQPGNMVGPSFRSFAPTAANVRYFPQLETMIENQLATWEVLPDVSRALNFCLTVRDNFWGGGCVDQIAIKLETVDTGRPFAVQYPNTDTTWIALSNQTIRWDVAATNELPIHTTQVDILLSLDGGYTYPVLLADNVPNNGSYDILVPAETSDKARIMVKAAGNIFFDISNENFTIAMPQALSVNIDAAQLSCAGEEDAALVAQPFGGTSPYSFQWSTGSEEANLSELGPGRYSLTVTDSEGQVMTTEASIDTLKPLELHFFPQDLVCNEIASGLIHTNVTGGVATYQWQWEGPNGFSSNTQDLEGLAGGWYSATVTDQRGCAVVGTTFLYDPNTSFYYDGDGDGYGDEEKMLHVCYSPKGYVKQAGDCDDNNSHLNPGVREVCDGIDNNCDGVIDDGFDRQFYYEDLDGDGFGNPNISMEACMARPGFVDNDLDCNDDDPTVYPNALEICDGIDNDCNGLVDEGGCTLKMERGTLKNVGSNWKMVYLQETYQSMVVIANVVMHSPTSKPVVTRIKATSGNTFEIKLQNPGGEVEEGYSVTFLVVEEGIYTAADHGVNMEAKKTMATATSSSEAWIFEQKSYENNYVKPVVIGQVMSYNDDRWSTFWASSASSRAVAPTATSFSVGKHVGEDSDTGRLGETIGYIVVEEGTYTIGGELFYAGVGSDMVRGVNNTSEGYYYPTPLRNMECAVVSLATMNGLDGGFPVLFSDSPFADSSLVLAIDEDQLLDTERSHSSEQVAFIAFAGPQPLPIYCEASSTSSEYEWIQAISLGDLTNESGNDGGYGDFTHQEIQVSPGESLLFSLMPGSAAAAYPEYWNIWIDYNQDGDFEDDNEAVLAITSHMGMFTGSFAIPEGAPSGKTLVRVAMKWGSASAFCGESGWGEVEDYTIVIGQEIVGGENTNRNRAALSNADGSKVTNAVLQVYPNPARDQLNITMDGEDSDGVIFQIRDMRGALVSQTITKEVLNQNSIHLNINLLHSGTYSLVIIKEDGSRLVQKFVKLP
ncbi:MAG: M12 family metallo-peptidase [Saprospiraceae bacterium]